MSWDVLLYQRAGKLSDSGHVKRTQEPTLKRTTTGRFNLKKQTNKKIAVGRIPTYMFKLLSV